MSASLCGHLKWFAQRQIHQRQPHLVTGSCTVIASSSAKPFKVDNLIIYDGPQCDRNNLHCCKENAQYRHDTLMDSWKILQIRRIQTTDSPSLYTHWSTLQSRATWLEYQSSTTHPFSFKCDIPVVFYELVYQYNYQSKHNTILRKISTMYFTTTCFGPFQAIFRLFLLPSECGSLKTRYVFQTMRSHYIFTQLLLCWVSVGKK